MQSAEQCDDRLAAVTSRSLASLLDAHSCSICHVLLSAPVRLPCAHIFCSECIRRHLCNTSKCPQPTCRSPATTRQLTPLRAYDVALEPLRRTAQKVEPVSVSDQKHLVFLSRKAAPKTQLIERLRSHALPTNGSVHALANRYNEFVIRWNANLDAGVPTSKKAVANAVIAVEKAAESAARRRGRTSSFFANAASHEMDVDADVPVEGDDFATLVSKTKARMRKALANANVDERDCPSPSTPRKSSDSQLETVNVTDFERSQISQLPFDIDVRPKKRPRPRDIQTVKDGWPVSGVGSRQDDAEIRPQNVVQTAHQSLSMNDGICRTDILGRTPELQSEKQTDPTAFPVERSYLQTKDRPRNSTQAPVGSQTTPEKRSAAKPGPQNSAESTKFEDAAPPSLVPQESGLQSSAPPPTQFHLHLADARTAGAHSLQVSSKQPWNVAISGSPPLCPPAATKIETRANPETHEHDVTPNNGRRSSSPDYADDKPKRKTAYVPEQIPTPEQLARAERNRIAAVERRKRFYARQRKSQMRQPDL